MATANDEKCSFDVTTCDLSRYSVLRKCLEDALNSTIQQTDHSEDFVPLHQYRAVLEELEHEREAHRKTKLSLTDVEDKLSFALGEVEILRKQIQREKAQFQMTFDLLKNRFTVDNQSSGSKSKPKSDVRDERTGDESIRDQLNEINVQIQQDLYISQLNDRSNNVKHRRATACNDSGNFPASSTVSAQLRHGRTVGSSASSATGILSRNFSDIKKRQPYK